MVQYPVRVKETYLLDNQKDHEFYEDAMELW